jgi:serine/threonine-protein kinase HipA
MGSIEKLFVSINLGGQEVDVGELVRSEKKIYFKYQSEFMDRGMQISPFKMPLTEKILTAEIDFFEGLFGVFNDSLPDGWGRLLLDRALMSRGILPGQLGPLDRLAYVGRGGRGALIYRPAIPPETGALPVSDMDEIAKQVKQVLEGDSTDVIDDLFILGGSSGGARPKILVGYNPKTDHLIADAENLPEGYEHWIIKFPSSSDPIDIANIEYAYSIMAMETGIEMSRCKLFRGRSGREYFGTRRFDREKGKRLHMHSASGLMHDNFRLSNMDYGHLMDCAFKLEKHVGAYEKILRLAAFNVYAHNRDDHNKNFSFLMDHTGSWRLAPAYDLTFSFSSHGMHSTLVDGESKDPGKTQLLSLAEQFGVKSPDQIIDEVCDVVANWKKYAKEAGVGKESVGLIYKTINGT